MTERKTISVTQVAKDNNEALRHVKVCFTDSSYGFETSINGTMDDVANYYVGASLNVGSYPEEVIKTPSKIQFIPRTESEPIVEYHLPSQKSRLYRGYEIEYVAPPIGTRAFDWQFTAIGYDGPE